MTACAHRNVGHIGILGVDKDGEEWYQVTIGGNQGEKEGGQTPAGLGRVIGPSFAAHEVPWVIQRLIELYLARRDSDAERFVDTVHRIGVEPFKEHVYAQAHSPRQDRARLATA